MAQSLKLKSFTSLANMNTQILDDDYVHGSVGTIKLKGATSGGAKFENKVKVSAKYSGQWKASIADEGKVQFPVCDNKYTLELSQRRNGDLKAHLDIGQINFKGKNFNLFTNIKTNVGFDNFQWRLGQNYFGKRCESNNRVEVVPGEPLVFSHRTFLRRNQYIFAGVMSLNLSTFQLLRYNAVLGYEDSNNDVYIKHESNPKADQVELGKLTLCAQRKLNDKTKLGLQVVQNNDKLNAGVGAQFNYSKDLLLKGKINTNKNIEFAAKYSWNNIILTTAALLNCSEGNISFNRFPPFPLGLQLDAKI